MRLPELPGITMGLLGLLCDNGTNYKAVSDSLLESLHLDSSNLFLILCKP